MKIHHKLSLLLIIIVTFISCEEFLDSLETGELTQEEVVEGLKTALKIGTDSSSSSLSILNGYYKGSPDLAIIPLPEEIQTVRNLINNNSTLANVSSVIGLNSKFDDLILAINRAAEDAANEAAPIFKGAIDSLSIADGFKILTGSVPSSTKSASEFDSTAATNYLINETYVDLVEAYAPKINASLDKKLVGEISAVDAWTTLSSSYNEFLNYEVEVTVLGLTVNYSIKQFNTNFMDVALPNELNSDLGAFSTELALDELFLRVANQEIKIRRNPMEWAIAIIQKVFSWVEEQS